MTKQIMTATKEDEEDGWIIDIDQVEEITDLALTMQDGITSGMAEAVICAMADCGYILIQERRY